MRSRHDEMQLTNDAQPTADRRFSKNDYTYQLLEKLESRELRDLLNELATKDLKLVTSFLHIRDLRQGEIGETQADFVRTTALRMYASGAVRVIVDRLISDLEEKTREFLGKHHANPSRRKIKKLTDVLIAEFGPLKTKMFYADAIDGEARASRHLLSELSQRESLSIDLYLHDESPIGPISPRPAPSEQVKLSRKDRRAEDKHARAVRRSQATTSREQDRVRKKDRARIATPVTPTEPESPTQPNPIQETKLQHGHLRRYRKASTDHPETGSVKSAFVSFEKEDPSEGKVRPCVVVAVAPNYYIVRPIYSRAGYFAGTWRAVLLADWREAGLDHESVVGHKTHKVRLVHVHRHVGKLTIRDWNRVCRGEVNETASA